MASSSIFPISSGSGPTKPIHQGQTVLLTETDGRVNWPSKCGLYFQPFVECHVTLFRASALLRCSLRSNSMSMMVQPSACASLSSSIAVV
jgi:hypothetical protein